MKKGMFLAITIAALAIWSCSNTGWQEDEMNVEPQPQTTSTIEGVKVPNPYSVEAMKAACDVLYPTTRTEGSISDEVIVATHIYARFLPTDKEQMDFLLDTGWELFNYPLDVEFDYDPSEYHDPSLPDDQITWQYTVIPIDTTLPTDITYEILEECYIPDDDETEVESTAGTIDIAAIEALSVNYAETGVMNPSASTMALTRRTYTGTITVDGSPVKGVKVRLKNGVIFKTTSTSNNGSYSVTGMLGNSPKVEVLFENNSKDYKVGFGFDLLLPTSINLNTTRTYNFTKTNNHKGWILCNTNNAVCDYYEVCSRFRISTPPRQLRVWAIPWGREDDITAAAPLLHHKTGYYIGLNMTELIKFIITGNLRTTPIPTGFSRILTYFGPDVVLCNSDLMNTLDIFTCAFHELAHTSHFRNTYSSSIMQAQWWKHVVEYEANCIVTDTNSPYGYIDTPNNGYCGVTEMWAHAVERICIQEILNHNIILYSQQSYPSQIDYWFKPEIIWDLHSKEGIPLQELYSALTKDATSISAYKQILTNKYPYYQASINHTFSSYGF